VAMMNFRKHGIRLAIAMIVNMAVSAFMYFEHYSEEDSFCDVSSYVSCSAVNKSEYAILFGVPISVFGYLWSITVLAALLYIRPLLKDSTKRELVSDIVFFLFLWCVGGAVFIIYLFCAEVAIGAICPFCTITHIMVLFSLYVSYCMNREMKATSSFPPLSRLVRSCFPLLVLVGVMFLAPIVFAHLPKILPNSHQPEARATTFSLRDHLLFSSCFLKTPGGLHFYGVEECSHCQTQKLLLGDLMSTVVYHECGGTCQLENNLKGIPTWKFTTENNEEKIQTGVQSPNELFDFLGCKEP